MVAPVQVALVVGLVGVIGCRSSATPGARTTATSASAPSASVSAPPPTPPSGPRLPTEVTPLGYRWQLTLDPAAADFAGEVAIDVALAAPTRAIWLSAEQLEVVRAEVQVGDQRVPATIVDDADHGRIGVVVASPLAAGAATVTVAYRGAIVEDDAVGVFRQTVAGQPYLFTQFEAIYARRAVPCLDEPAAKAPWQVTIDAPAGLTVVANTREIERAVQGDRARVRFAPTAPLPSYLVAFAVGRFDAVEVGPVGRGAVPARVLTPYGQGDQAAAAAALTPRAVAALEAYVDRPLPGDKLDLLAVPTLFGAMEHPGLITFAAEILLEDPARPSRTGARQLRHVLTHELAHQWFGNLVTPRWWDDLWLAEAFATWLGERIAHQLDRRDDPILDALTARERALAADARPDARPLRRPIVGGLDVDDSFDAIAYEKGAALLDMVEARVGAGPMRAALRAYLAAHAERTASADDLLAALAAEAGPEARDGLASFLDRPGAPRVALALDCATTPAAVATVDDARWRAPLCVRFPDRGDGWGQACGWLRDGVVRLELPRCPAWIAGNPDGRGYLRVGYPPDLDRALRDHLPDLAMADRLTRALDLAADVRAGAAPLAAVGPWIDALVATGNRYDLLGALALAEVASDHVGPAQRRAWQRWVRLRFGAAVVAVGAARIDDTAAQVVARERVTRLVGVDGAEPSMGRAARARVTAWLSGGASLGDDRDRLLAIATAAPPPELRARLVAALSTLPDRADRAAILDALGALTGPADRTSNRALYTSGAVDAVDGLALVTGGLGSDVDAEAWRELTADYDAIAARLSEFDRAELIAAAGARCSEAAAVEVEAFFAPHAAREPRLALELPATLTAIRACAAERARIAPGLDALLRR